MKIDDVRTYIIQIQGRVEEADINSTGPLRLTLGQEQGINTCVHLQTDQSGLIGLIRHLHGLGLVLLSVVCAGENTPDPDSKNLFH